MKTALMFAASVMMLVSGSAMANADLAKSKNCMSCHSVDAKILGPSFKDIAKNMLGIKPQKPSWQLK